MQLQLTHDLVVTKIEDHSWDYSGEFTKTHTHGLHSYPAMMIPPVARRLIISHSNEGDTLLDPFCGSGSVLVEAKLNKRNSWGVDINPLAILVARVKTRPIAPDILRKELQIVLEKVRQLRDDSVDLPDFPNLHFWFKESVISGLAKLLKAINSVEQADVREFFQVVFSEVTRLSSNTRSHEFKLYRYAPKKLETWEPNPIGLFEHKAAANIVAMEKFWRDDNNGHWARPILSDIRKISEIPPNSIDIVVTSPPYGDSRTTVAYGQYTRLSSQWLGLIENRNLDRESLGGIPTETLEHSLPSPTLDRSILLIAGKDEQRAREVLSFYVDLNESLIAIDKLVRQHGVICFVLGNRTVKGVCLPTDEILVELFSGLGYNHLTTIIRNIPSKSMPLQNSPTNRRGEIQNTMHQEHIIVMEKS